MVPEIPIEKFQVVHTALSHEPDVTVRGEQYGAGVSIIMVSTDEDGYGPALHQHPYREVIAIHAGSARFTVGETAVVAGAGDVLVIPAWTPHSFEVVGGTPYLATDIHESPRMITDWLTNSR